MIVISPEESALASLERHDFSSFGNHRHRFYFDERVGLDESTHLDDGHCREDLAHDFAIGLADLGKGSKILLPVEDIPGHSDHVLGAGATFTKHVEGVAQSLSELFDEAWLEAAVSIPANETRGNDQSAAGRNSVGIAPRAGPAFRLEDPSEGGGRCIHHLSLAMGDVPRSGYRPFAQYFKPKATWGLKQPAIRWHIAIPQSKRGKERMSTRGLGDHQRYQPHTKQSLRLWLRLLDTATVVEKTIRSYLRSNCDSTLPRFDVLAALDRAGSPVTMTQLSERLLVSNGNVTGVVARLVEDGFVMRKTDQSDRRTQRVSLTGKGRRHFAAMARKHEALVDRIFADVSDIEMERLLRQLTNLNKSIHERLDEERR